MYIIYHIPRTCVEIIEIKYIYLTPILHTYTSRPYVYYVGIPYICPPHIPYVYTPTA